MGKTIIQQARGHGSMTYRVRRKAFSVYPHYPKQLQGEFIVAKLFSSGGHSAPIAKIVSVDGKVQFFNIAANGIYQGQKIKIGGLNAGDITRVGDLETSTRMFNVENTAYDGGKFVRTGGNSAIVVSKNKDKNTVKILLPSKKEKELDANCRVTIGIIAGAGRLDKPILKAGKQHHIKKVKNKLWPRTSALKMNAIDHPFGSGRGKRIKSKIAKNNAPPGAKVGLLHPRRTGRKKK